MISRSLFCTCLLLQWKYYQCSAQNTDDTQPPNLWCFGTIEETTTSSYATVTWVEPVVTDNVDAGLTATCSPFSGSFFAVGSTTVTCSSTDEAGNTGSCTFTVNVFDVGIPELVCSADLYVGRRRQYQSTIIWDLPEVKDNVDKTLSPSCIDFYGSSEPLASPVLLPSGIYTITCSATDDSGNIGTCVFKIIVRYDEVPPILNCPKDIHITAPGRTIVTWNDPLVIDDFDSAPLTAVCTRRSGSMFSSGLTSVSCHSTDIAGNTGTCSFKVNVTVGDVPSDDSQIEGESEENLSENNNEYVCTDKHTTTSLDWKILILAVITGAILLIMFPAFVFFCRFYFTKKDKLQNECGRNLNNIGYGCPENGQYLNVLPVTSSEVAHVGVASDANTYSSVN